MKPRFKIAFILILLPLLFAFAFPAWAVSASASSYDEESGKTYIDTNWWFESIAVEMDVRRDKTVRVTETMQVGFIKGEKNTGIIRDIQRMSRTTRVIDGKQKEGKTYLATLSDVEVTINGAPAKVTRSYYSNGDFFSVKMQKPDQSYFPATDQSDPDDYNTFVLSYVYGMGDDKAAGYDDFTFDVLGYAMDYTKRFSATVTFPEELDEAAVSFRTNQKAAWEPSEGEYARVEGNTVTMYARPMHENKGYTLQVLFEDGYFETVRTFYWYFIPFAVIAVLAMVAAIVIFLNYVPKKPVEQVEFYPPEGMRAMRYSAIWYGEARKKDVAAVITQWAAEGFVRLEKDGRKDLTVYKLKDFYVENSRIGDCEQEYFNAMFPSGDWTGSDVFSTRQMTAGGYPERKVKLGVYAEALTNEANEPSPLKKHSMLAHVLFTILMLVPMLMTLVYACILSRSILPFLFFLFMAAGTGVGSMQARQRMTPLLYVFPAAFMGLPLFAFSSFLYLPLYDYCGLLWISLVWWAVGIVLLHFMRRRSPEAEAQLGKMRGFKRFLLTAELDRIERLFDENPEYYSQIIPYCLIMDISEKVAKRFEALNIVTPEWAAGIPMRSFSSFSRSLSTSSGGSSGGGGGHGGSSGGGGSRGC